MPREERILNKWGKLVKPFSSYTPDEVTEMLDYAEEVIAHVQEASGLSCFLISGALLGAVREGRLLPHDDDIDLAIDYGESDRVEVARRSASIMRYLLDRGYELNAPAYGQYKVLKRSGGRKMAVELFAAWSEGDLFYQYFAVHGKPIVDDVYPLTPGDFLGRSWLFPHRPEPLLAANYGESWRVPDPHYDFAMNPEKWASFKYLFFSRNVPYWNRFYLGAAAQDAEISRPSLFASTVAQDLPTSARLLDVGCGNGRDAAFFASLGHHVTAIDYSEQAIAAFEGDREGAASSVSAERLNLYDVPKVHAFQLEHRGEFDAVYARFLLHAISEVAELTLLDLAAATLRAGGHLHLEFKVGEAGGTVVGRDIGHDEYMAGHYRRLVSSDAVKENARAAGFSVAHLSLGTGLAPHGPEDPTVCRMVLRR